MPEPLGPTIETTSPGSTCTETPRMTGSPPYPAVDARRRAAAAPRRRRSADKVSLHDLAAAAQLGHRPLGEHAPSAITITGSQNSSMIASSCSTISDGHARPRQSATSSSPIRRARFGCTPAIGSSSSSTCGLGHQRAHDLHQPALAAAEVAGVAVGVAPRGRTGRARLRPGRSRPPPRRASTAARAARRGSESPRLPGTAASRFSSTVSRLNSLASWNVRTSPSRARR